MTTIAFRQTDGKRKAFPSGGSYTPFLSRIASRWQQWRSLRELESLSDDMRKDMGWPAANETNDPKAMR